MDNNNNKLSNLLNNFWYPFLINLSNLIKQKSTDVKSSSFFFSSFYRFHFYLLFIFLVLEDDNSVKGNICDKIRSWMPKSKFICISVVIAYSIIYKSGVWRFDKCIKSKLKYQFGDAEVVV